MADAVVWGVWLRLLLLRSEVREGAELIPPRSSAIQGGALSEITLLDVEGWRIPPTGRAVQTAQGGARWGDGLTVVGGAED